MERKEILKSLNEGTIYDYIANHYWEMSNYELKEILLAVISGLYDEIRNDEKVNEIIKNELDDRWFFEE